MRPAVCELVELLLASGEVFAVARRRKAGSVPDLERDAFVRHELARAPHHLGGHIDAEHPVEAIGKGEADTTQS